MQTQTTAPQHDTRDRFSIETDWMESNNLMTAIADLLMELSINGKISNIEDKTMEAITGFFYTESKKAGNLFYELMELHCEEEAKEVSHE